MSDLKIDLAGVLNSIVFILLGIQSFIDNNNVSAIILFIGGLFGLYILIFKEPYIKTNT